MQHGEAPDGRVCNAFWPGSSSILARRQLRVYARRTPGAPPLLPGGTAMWPCHCSTGAPLATRLAGARLPPALHALSFTSASTCTPRPACHPLVPRLCALPPGDVAVVAPASAHMTRAPPVRLQRRAACPAFRCARHGWAWASRGGPLRNAPNSRLRDARCLPSGVAR